MGKYRITTEGGVYEITTEDTPQPQASAPSPLATGVAQAGLGAFGTLGTAAELGKGFLKSIALPSVQTGDIIRRGFGMERIIDKPEVRQMITPTGPAQQAGFAAGTAAQFFAPSGLISAGTRTVQGLTQGMRGATLANLAARTGMEAAGAAGITGLQTGGDPEAMKQAALTSGGITAALGGASAAAGPAADLLRRSALTQYGRVLNPTKEKTKQIAQRIIPEMIQRREWGHLPNILNRAQDRMRFFGQQIDDVWDQMRQAGVAADVVPILQRLEDVATEHFHVRNAAGQLVPLQGPAASGLREMQGIAQTIRDAAVFDPVRGQHIIPTDTLRALRQYWDEVADKSGAFTKRPQDLHSWVTGRVHRYAGDAVRAELAQATPDLARINREFSFWNNVAEVTEQTLQRRTGQQKPLTRRIAQLTGAAAGGGGIMSILGAAAMDQLQGLISSATWGSLSAVNKSRLADAIARGNRGQAEFYLNKLVTGATEAGRRLTDEERIQELLKSKGKKMLPYEYAPQSR